MAVRTFSLRSSLKLSGLALLALLGSVACQVATPTPGGTTPPAQGDPGVLPPVNLNSLSNQPVRQWGVTGIGNTNVAAKPHVWDILEYNNRIYVAGAFTGVQQKGGVNPTPIYAQSYVAAFDRDSGDWVSSFRPKLDRAVYDLEITPQGTLLLGGEFTSVNGTAKTGLAAVNPNTGALDTTFGTTIIATKPMIRTILKVGSSIYVGGRFSRVVSGGNVYWRMNGARLSASTGAVDASFKPQFAGGVIDLAIDVARGRVHAVGSFTSVAAQPSTAGMVTVNATTGVPVAGLRPYQFNDPRQTYTVSVAYADNRIYVGGSQHILQVLDGATNARIGYNTTGIVCDAFLYAECGNYVAGGDMQVLEVTAGGLILAGCHCFESKTSTFVNRTHFSSFTGQRTGNKVAIGYRTSDSRVASNFVPDLTPNKDGTYALSTDTRGCYYVGGYYTRANNGSWLGGFARFCQPVADVRNLSGTSPSAGRAVLTWSAATSQLPVSYYKIYRNGVWVRDTTSLSAGFTGLTPGATYKFEVEARDVSRRRSAGVTVSVKVAAADTVAPSVPTSLTATRTATGVRLNWGASTDANGVKDYLVTLNGPLLASVPAGTLTYQHNSLTPGTRTYGVRARDFSGNISASTTVRITI